MFQQYSKYKYKPADVHFKRKSQMLLSAGFLVRFQTAGNIEIVFQNTNIWQK